MNISGIPLQVTLTDLPAKSTPAGTARENISIYEDGITAVLWQRWIACYMLYDWNFRHADFAYESNKYTWIGQVCKRLEGTSINAGALENTLTDTFNHVLLEDLEDFIQTHMRVWECDRLTVEFHVTRVIAKLFTVKPKGGNREPDIRVPLFTYTRSNLYNLRKREVLFMTNTARTIQELSLSDGFLFAKVMDDKEICRKVLEKILGIPIQKVSMPDGQRTAGIPHSIQRYAYS